MYKWQFINTIYLWHPCYRKKQLIIIRFVFEHGIYLQVVFFKFVLPVLFIYRGLPPADPVAFFLLAANMS